LPGPDRRVNGTHSRVLASSAHITGEQKVCGGVRGRPESEGEVIVGGRSPQIEARPAQQQN
jgi:hypothetical protein